ncbi:MAG: hypothetical protein EBV29_09485 [Gammaproteobacteria bacterium]|nr:hypothetical protein [Gammaproteobacteria bacterium]
MEYRHDRLWCRAAARRRECHHFGVTWEPALPYLCKEMGFKSARLPSQEVLAADGHPCRAFSSKTSVQNSPIERSYFRK